MRYRVHRSTDPSPLGAGWAQRPWDGAAALHIDNVVGRSGQHRPPTRAKLLYDDAALYAIFRVDDRYVRAVAESYHHPVCRDSCVELFFTPGPDVAKGYFNVEVNCGGVLLAAHQLAPRQGRRLFAEDHCRRIQVRHSLPARVEPEMTSPVTWTVSWRLPLEVLRQYAPVARPTRGVLWRANAYKCGDATSHPHWLAWAPVPVPQPDFHRPEFFGRFIFT